MKSGTGLSVWRRRELCVCCLFRLRFCRVFGDRLIVINTRNMAGNESTFESVMSSQRGGDLDGCFEMLGGDEWRMENGLNSRDMVFFVFIVDVKSYLDLFMNRYEPFCCHSLASAYFLTYQNQILMKSWIDINCILLILYRLNWSELNTGKSWKHKKSIRLDREKWE